MLGLGLGLGLERAVQKLQPSAPYSTASQSQAGVRKYNVRIQYSPTG